MKREVKATLYEALVVTRSYYHFAAVTIKSQDAVLVNNFLLTALCRQPMLVRQAAEHLSGCDVLTS